MCGRCGKRMTVRYHSRHGRLVPDYLCQREGIEHGEPICQHIPGASIDERVGDLLVEALMPVTIDVALAVQQELQMRLDEADRLRQQQVERARYEVELARRRYLRVDPDSRLVADSLEADWNGKLKLLTEAQEACERQRTEYRKLIDDQQRAAIRALATTFPQLWRDPTTPDGEKKRMIRLLIEDATSYERIISNCTCLQGRRPPIYSTPPSTMFVGAEANQPSPEVVTAIDRLLDHHPYPAIAAQWPRQEPGAGSLRRKVVIDSCR